MMQEIRLKTEKDKDLERILQLPRPTDNERYFACGYLLWQKNDVKDVIKRIENCNWMNHYKALLGDLL